jgi:hypothetical protein
MTRLGRFGKGNLIDTGKRLMEERADIENLRLEVWFNLEKPAATCVRSEGQNAKYSERADDFRFVPRLGHYSMRSARLKGPTSGHARQHRTKLPPIQ